MYQSSLSSDVLLSASNGSALLVTVDALLFLDLQAIFHRFAIGLTPVHSADEAAAMMRVVYDLDYVLLDARMPWVADGSVLVPIEEWSASRRGAVVLVANNASDEWIERLRQGVIDDIVSLTADSSFWLARLSAIQRHRRTHAELEDLRVTTQAEMERDPLTGAFSREMVLKLLFRETDRVQRLRGELSVMLFALEGIEWRLDELGRQVCDGLLREVAARVGRALRSYDLLGRSGNCEFLVALPGGGLANARTLAQRLQIEVFGEPFLTQTGSGDYAALEVKASFVVVPSLGRSPLVVLREAESALAEVRRAMGSRTLAAPGSGDEAGQVIEADRKSSHFLAVGAGRDKERFHGLG